MVRVANDLCEKSMRIGEIIGDQAWIARAGNALSLVLNDQAKLYRDKDKIIRAVNLLDSLLPGREAAWDLRLCFQILRNLEVMHTYSPAANFLACGKVPPPHSPSKLRRPASVGIRSFAPPFFSVVCRPVPWANTDTHSPVV